MNTEGQIIITKEIISKILKPREADSHKGTYGHALLIAGDKGKMGAAVIAAKACLRGGTGLLTVHVPVEERCILQTAIPEAMLSFRKSDELDFSKYSSVGIGPGIGTGDEATALVENVLRNTEQAILIDADALNIISMDNALRALIPAHAIITPHPKEFDRLFGESKSTEEREAKAIKLSAQYPWIIVLKGHETLIAAHGKFYRNNNGNAGLAKGGSGDMLSGIITALLAQHYSCIDAALAGVYLHGLAADLSLQHQSMESLLATDIIESLGKAFTETMKK